MTMHLHQARALRLRRPQLVAIVVVAIMLIAVLWGVALFRTTSDTGSLESRVTAVGNTVRCPVCPEPIPLNDIYNPQALQMRQFIRDELRLGRSEDTVRQELVERYGPDILLAPPQHGFDLLAWIVPLGAVAVCAVGVTLVVRRWSSGGGPGEIVVSDPPAAGADSRKYEQLLDRELAARE